MSWGILIDRVIAFLQKVVPGLVAAFVMGYNMAKKQTQKAESETRDLKLKLEYEENKNAIEKKFANKSDADVAAELVSGKLTKPDA